MRDRENWISRRHLIGAAAGLSVGALLNVVAGTVPTPELPRTGSRRWPAETPLAWTAPLGSPVAALHPVGRQLCAVDEFGTVHSRESATGVVRWRLKTGQGRVYSNGVAFVGGRAYVGGNRLSSVDLSTGKRLARIDENTPFVVAESGKLYTGGNWQGDPATYGWEYRRVDPELTATLWRRRLVGFTSTLIPAGERLIADTSTELHALDARTGATQWKRASDAGHLIAAGADHIVAAGYDHVVVLDPATGADRWIAQDTAPECAAVVDDTIILGVEDLPGVGWWNGRGAAGFDARDGEHRWQIDGLERPFHTADGLLFTRVDSRVCALDPAGGQVIWRSDEIGYVEQLVAGDGMVYAADSSGDLFAWHGPR
ncbi:PQQ-binding-like beta-propeller repeat protein [Actinoplanes sp. NBRC 103695]|uniref:outer membrane protein assembly factor BamB family protein n=1 Tax=Actinoplanes sp. NBRC 103695 TaxID=3032202 RepID=UPI002553ABA1|nr:PQQ-binding-like beta-propeller repeat protein [Actinoplanes sp. NBRC 103695]